LIEEIERQGMNAVCVFSNGMPVLELGMQHRKNLFYMLPDLYKQF